MFSMPEPLKEMKNPQISVKLCVLSFPFSNASVERVLSQLILIIAEHESLLALLTTNLTLKQKGDHQAAKFKPPRYMLRLY